MGHPLELSLELQSDYIPYFDRISLEVFFDLCDDIYPASLQQNTVKTCSYFSSELDIQLFIDGVKWRRIRKQIIWFGVSETKIMMS